MIESLHGWLGLILGFSGLIFIHELGHFVLAKWNGVRVYVFSVGMGPYLFSFTWHGTVYALSMIPIGGYVKLMGQDDLNPNQEISKDTSDYRNKRPGQKAAILAAGAIFNLIFALFAFTLCYWHGIYTSPPRIGNIAPDRPLAKAYMFGNEGKREDANLHRGDRILEVNGVPVSQILDAAMQVSGASRGEPITLKVERLSQLDRKVDYIFVEPKEDKKIGASGIGLDGAPYTEKVPLPLGFKTDDHTIAVATAPEPSTPAAQAGIQAGDEVIEITNTETKEVKPVHEFSDLTNMVRGSEGKPLQFKINRDGKELNLTVTPAYKEKPDTYQVGIAPISDRVTEIDPDSEAYKAGLRKGHFVAGFIPDDPNSKVWKSGKLNWFESLPIGENTQSKKVHLTVPDATPTSLVYNENWQVTELTKATDVWEAFHWACTDTWHYSASVFTVLKGLLRGNISLGAVSGPVGIGAIMHNVARDKDFLNFLWLLAFISVNLGVMQFIPIPLLDGFHLVMVFVEKMKGSPVAPKIQEAFQYAGLFIVGSLLLMATYHDILRVFTKG